MAIKEIELDGEKIYLKKSFLGWSIVYPIKENGRINWTNLIAGGNWIKFTLVVIFIFLLLLAISEVSGIIKTANECLNANKILISP